MKITALVENTSSCELESAHGLALYIETARHKLLFDLGPDDTLFVNARMRDIDLSKVDTVIISHGHSDHGGALERFFTVNHTAKVYVQETAFEEHHSVNNGVCNDRSLLPELRHHPQVMLLNGDFKIDEELQLFQVKDRSQCYSPANDNLYHGDQKDDFRHEQHLIIQGHRPVLIMGCGHTGVVNIMKEAEKYQPVACIGGYHLMKPKTGKTVPTELLDQIAERLNRYQNTEFYTCHCTGVAAYEYLAKRVRRLHYLSCGDSIEF